MYFTMRTAIPEFFADRDITRPELQQIIELGESAVMPGLTADGKRVVVARAAAVDFETPDIANFMKIIFMTGDLRLKMEKMGVLGDVYVLDGSVAVLKHFLKVNPAIVKKFFVCVQEAYPVKSVAFRRPSQLPPIWKITKMLPPQFSHRISTQV